jgi:hypothetical protein
MRLTRPIRPVMRLIAVDEAHEAIVFVELLLLLLFSLTK